MTDEKIDIEEEMIKEVNEYSRAHKPTPEEIKSKKDWEKRRKHICKPCWELKYCPYGPLVESFPPVRPTREEAIEHNEFLRKQLKKSAYKGWRKKHFEDKVKNFNPKGYPEKYSQKDIEGSCLVFGHICPVFFINEPLTETLEMRRISRIVSRVTMLKVARRDNSTCQICGKHLLDNEIEFDHKIPFSKGGSTEENNIQVACFDCNRSKNSKTPNHVKKYW